MRSNDVRFPQTVKVRYVIPEQDPWHGVTAERLWAESCGDGLYAIKNIPGYALDLAPEDVVELVPGSIDNDIARVVRRGGHSVLQLVFMQGSFEPDDLARLIEPLLQMGCRCEDSQRHFAIAAIAVPPNVDLEVVRRLLNKSKRRLDFEIIDACNSPRTQ